MERIAPRNGGWGYFAAATLVLVLAIAIMPMVSMGLIFADFITTHGYDATDLTLVSIISTATSNLIGIVASPLLGFYSTRVVALIGATLVVIANFLSVSIQSFADLVLYYGIIQGFGVGLLVPATFSSFQTHFDSSLTVAVSVVYVACTLLILGFPTLVVFLLQQYGAKTALKTIAFISTAAVFTSLFLRDAKQSEVNAETALLKKRSFCGELSHIFKLRHLFNPLNLNILVGMSLSFTTDIAFLTVAPLMLAKSGFTPPQIGLLMTSAIVGDVATTVGWGVLHALRNTTKINRLVFFGATFLTIVIRELFVYLADFKSKMVLMFLVGSSRGLVQTNLSVILSDNFPNLFANAYSFFRAICGITTICLGLVLYVFKTDDTAFLVHILDLANGVCVFCWLLEFLISARV